MPQKSCISGWGCGWCYFDFGTSISSCTLQHRYLEEIKQLRHSFLEDCSSSVFKNICYNFYLVLYFLHLSSDANEAEAQYWQRWLERIG